VASHVLNGDPGSSDVRRRDRRADPYPLATGGTSRVFLVTDDCRKAYEDLASRGVEFQETPEERPYGIDAGFRDPSINSFWLTQVKDLD
jgi:hypothetical protein